MLHSDLVTECEYQKLMQLSFKIGDVINDKTGLGICTFFAFPFCNYGTNMTTTYFAFFLKELGWVCTMIFNKTSCVTLHQEKLSQNFS